jgi:hypothetical protein
MDSTDERMRILEMLESGKIDAEQAVLLIQALEDAPEPTDTELMDTGQVEPAEAIITTSITAPEAESKSAPSGLPDWQAEAAGAATPDDRPEVVEPEVMTQPKPPDFDKWRRFWVVPLWIGVGIAVLGGLLMNWALASTGGYGFWFFCATLPMLLGVLVIVLAWLSRTARWLHLRVQQAPGEKPQRIVLSFPLPLRLTAWFMRTFRHRIPQMQETNFDEILQAVGESTSPETPLYIEVDEGENGEKVQIYIG